MQPKVVHRCSFSGALSRLPSLCGMVRHPAGKPPTNEFPNIFLYTLLHKLYVSFSIESSITTVRLPTPDVPHTIIYRHHVLNGNVCAEERISLAL